MLDFVVAFKAHLPFIAVHTDDPVNVRMVLQHLAGKGCNSCPRRRMRR